MVAVRHGFSPPEDTSPSRGFHCDVTREPDAVTVRPVGELDLATVPVLEAQLAQSRAAAVRRVRLDLRGLRFIDSSGLHLILRCDLDAQRDGYALELVPGAPAVQRVFELSGLTARLPFVDA